MTSIAVRNLSSGQTESFSIHKVAEQKGIELTEIKTKYDELEKSMLTEFYDFVTVHKSYDWIHWNMRDINYGFPALEHRFRVLGGTPVEIEESRKFDLARALISIYGTGYIGHPRLVNLIKKNRIATLNFLTGQEEAVAFENQEYVKLHQSTLRKVDIIANIFGRSSDRSLKSNARWHEIYGFHPKAILEFVSEHWLVALLGLLALIFGLINNVIV